MAEERVQRRLAAILAADVVGYSRMMREHEAGTLAQLKSFRKELLDPKVGEYGGRIFKNTGDGALAEFGSANDAVQSAVEIQRELIRHNADIPEDRRITLRIGISLGDVMVDGDDLFGNGVNVAARMESLAEPGAICISGNVHEHVGDLSDITLEDLGEQTVKNIDRPVRCYRVHLGSSRARGPVEHEPNLSLPLPEKPSIAVLPFDNLSGDPEQEYFADGIAEDIITSLSRFSWFFVIARNSSFSYKGTSPDVRQVSRDLGVRYVVEGSVRKSGDHVRITAQLIDAGTGRHIWADRYDRELSDIFAVQDEITEAITGAVAPAFASAEVRRAAHETPGNLDAWDLTMRGNWHYWRCNRDDVAEAKRLFELAVQRDNRSAIAFSGLAITYVQEIIQGWSDEPRTARERAYQAAKHAVALDDQDAWAHAIRGYIDHVLGNDDAAFTQVRRAIELNPNLPFAEGILALIHAHLGHYDDATLHAEKAARLSPRDPTNVMWIVARAVASFVTERYEEHYRWSKALTEAVPEWPPSWRHLAVACVYLDHHSEADDALRELRRLSPQESGNLVRVGMSFFQPPQLERFIDGLRKAGLPE